MLKWAPDGPNNSATLYKAKEKQPALHHQKQKTNTNNQERKICIQVLKQTRISN